MAARCCFHFFLIFFCLVVVQSLIFKLRGQQVQFDPENSQSPSIIQWLHNNKLVLEYEGVKETVSDSIKGRVTLSRSTAQLQISELRLEDSGTYECQQFNGEKWIRSVYELEVIEKVSKPTITCELSTLISSNRSAVLFCTADHLSQSQSSLKFEWIFEEKRQRGRYLRILLGGEHDEQRYTCLVSNPLSEESVTFTAKDCSPDEGPSAGPIAAAIIAPIVILIFIAAVGVTMWCKMKHKGASSPEEDEDQLDSLVDDLQELLQQQKISLQRRCECLTEGTNEAGSQTLLNSIHTELYITDGLSEEVNSQHEVRQLETKKTKRSLHDRPIRCSQIFEVSPEQQGLGIRVVLTNGVAGVGKTFSVQKFTMDWAQGLENQDLHLVVTLSFRELNMVKEQHYSLLKLLHVFHPTLEELTAKQLKVCKLLCILDGLDESRLALDFEDHRVVTKVTQKKSVSILLTNLIRGDLLPSALLWITSRPAAANQIPPSCVDRLTEVRGFTDDQKEEYFRRRFTDREDVSSRIISHIKASRSLHIMCQIPVFCWITATVLENTLSSEQRGELPKTLTDLYSHFLLVQTKRKKNKYGGDHQTTGPQKLTKADRTLLKLGKLAFKHLKSGNIMFYSEDLEKCGLSVIDASVYSGVCREIFRRESVIFHRNVYCFVHLSVQEFLAAVYIFHCHTNKKKTGDGPPGESLDDFLKRMTKKSLQSPNGHLDLFVRFLHGLSLESNQRLLKHLLGDTDNHPGTLEKVISNLKEMNTGDVSPERSINIIHCLLELKDQSVQEINQEVQEFPQSEDRSEKGLFTRIQDPLKTV